MLDSTTLESECFRFLFLELFFVFVAAAEDLFFSSFNSKFSTLAIKCHNTPGDNDSGSYEINLPYYGGGTSEEWLIWKDKLLKALECQSINTEPQSYTFTERLLTGDAKATFNQAALDIGIRTIDNFNKLVLEMTKHAFPGYMLFVNKRGNYIGT